MIQITKKIADNIGSEAQVLRYHGYRYFGRLESFNDTHIQIRDFRSGNVQSIKISDIEDITFKKPVAKREIQ